MRELRWMTALFILGGFLLFAVGRAGAQSSTTGQITGVVKDPSGAVIADAKITLTSDAGVRARDQQRRDRSLHCFACPSRELSGRNGKARVRQVHYRRRHCPHYRDNPA